MRPHVRAFRYAAVVALLAGSFWFGRLVVHNHRTHADPPVTPSTTTTEPVAIVGHGLDGETEWIRAVDLQRRTLLLVMSVECPFCERNMPTWVELVDALEASPDSADVDVRVLSVSSAEDTRAYLERHRLAAPVLLVDRTEVRALGLAGVPATLALTPGSEVVRHWSGVLDERAQTAVLDWSKGPGAMTAEGPATEGSGSPPPPGEPAELAVECCATGDVGS